MVSAIIFAQSLSRPAFEKALGSGSILLSLPLWNEICEVLARQKFQRYFRTDQKNRFLQEISENAEFVKIVHLVTACRDPKDNMVLELAVSGQADYIVTRDKDLLTLDPFQGIRIVTPELFLDTI